MTRAQDSEEVSEVKEEKATNIVSDWDAPDLIERLEEKASQVGGGAVHQGASPGRVEGETVFFCNYTKNSMHPQSIQSSLPSFAPVATSPFALSDGSLSFPNCETLWSSGLRAS